MKEISLDIRIRPGIAPDDRHQIEDAIGEAGVDVAGGGGFNDGSESDIMAYSTNVRADLPVVIDILRNAKVGQDSCVTENGKHEHPVYGEIMDPLSKPWWKFW